MGGVGWGNNVHVTSRSSQVEDSWTLCSAFREGMGEVGWGNNVHVTSRSSQVEDSWTLCSAFRGGWVGWGGAITFMSRPVHLKLKTPGLCALHSGGGWVGWGGAITFMSRPVHLKLKTPGLCALHSGGMGGVGWGNNVHVTSRSSQVEASWTLCLHSGGMGGVGWGNNVHVTSRSSQVEDSWTLCSAFRRGWVGWGGAITFMSRPVHLKLKAPGLLCSAFREGMGGVGWGNNVHVTSRSSQVEDSWTLCSAFRGGWVGWGGAITFMSRPVHLKLKTPGLYVRLHTVELNKLFAFQILLLGIYYLMALGLRPPIFVFRAQAVERTLSECKSISAEYRASQENRRRIIETTGTA